MSNTEELQRLQAENAALRQDLSDARRNWEDTVSEVHDMHRLDGLSTEVREQLIDAAKAAEAVLSSQKQSRSTVVPASIALAKLRAALVVAGAA